MVRPLFLKERARVWYNECGPVDRQTEREADMLLKVFSVEESWWEYFKLPDQFRVGNKLASLELFDFSDEESLTGEKSGWVLRSVEPQAEDVVTAEMYGFDVLFTHPKRLKEFKKLRGAGKGKQEDPEPQVPCIFVTWFEGNELKGVGIVGTGYIINDNGKTIEKIQGGV